ncbi:MAG: glutaredoxin family protein [Candidatus Methanoperedens sp.]
MKITVYSTPTCPNCVVLKELLKKTGLEFSEVNMATPAGLTELRINGVFAMSAPVLQIDGSFYQRLCNEKGLNVDLVKGYLLKHGC